MSPQAIALGVKSGQRWQRRRADGPLISTIHSHLPPLWFTYRGRWLVCFPSARLPVAAVGHFINNCDGWSLPTDFCTESQIKLTDTYVFHASRFSRGTWRLTCFRKSTPSFVCLQPVSELHLSLLPSKSEGVCSSALCDVTRTADTYSRLVTEPPWFLPLRQRCPCPLPNMWKGATRNQV